MNDTPPNAGPEAAPAEFSGDPVNLAAPGSLASESQRMKFVIATLVFAGLADGICAKFALGWRAASLLTVILVVSMLAFTVRYRDKFFGQLFVFGLIAGFAELPSDHYAVADAKVLVYPQEGPFIWSSPLYMPFSYIIVMVQLGYLSYRATQRWGLWKATLAIALFGGMNVPMYEYLAKGADFWYYQNCQMAFGTVPYFTIASEAVFSMALPVMVKFFPKLGWAGIFGLGLAEGAVMYVSFVIGLKIFG